MIEAKAYTDHWQSQLRNSLKTKEDFQKFFELDELPLSYPAMIPKVFADKVKRAGKDSALWKQFIPNMVEDNDDGMIDPIGDQIHAKNEQLIHRYENRVLLAPTNFCPIICRYCFRKNELYDAELKFKNQLVQSIKYIKAHPEIDEVIFTGGDPLVLSDQNLDKYLSALSDIDHLKNIRFHTRTPVILPSRITSSFVRLLEQWKKRFNNILVVIHINHQDEWSEELAEGLQRLAQANIKLLSQTVLLKNVNDDALELINLFKLISDHHVSPYYLHHPDMAKGAMHFYLGIEEGRKIFAQLRTKLSGWQLPSYIVDVPGGHGKTNAFNSESITFSGSFLSHNMEKIPYSKL